MALINRDPRVINDWTKGNKNDVPSMELYRREKKSREDEDDRLWAALRKEIADRIAGDDALWAALRKEIADRIAADDAERAARIAADDAERAARIAEDEAIWAALRQEIADRIAGDDAIWAALRQEIADRIAGDATLQNSINSEITARTNGDSSEANARAAEDSRIWAAINSLSGSVTNIINTPSPTIRVSDVVGDWPTTRIDGKLEPKNIDIDKLKNTLEAWVKSLAQCNCSGGGSSGGGSDGIGISDCNIGSSDGYIEFSNGVLIQFGRVQVSSGSKTVTFPKAFTKQPFVVFAGNASFGGNTTSAPEMAFIAPGNSSTVIELHCNKTANVTWLAIGK